MIRPATPDDIPRLVDLGHQLHALSTYAPIRYVPEKVAALLGSLLRSGSGVIFVAERGGVVVGGFAGGITEFWFSNEKTAFDYSFFIEPASRHGITAVRLIAAFELWAMDMGARAIELGITTGMHVDSTSNLYRRLGYADAGSLFRKRV